MSFGGGVQNDVRAPGERLLTQGCGEGRVDNGQRTVLVCAFDDGRHVGDEHGRVGDGLHPDHVGALGGGDHRGGVRGVDGAYGQASVGLGAREQVRHAVVGGARKHHDAAGRDEVGDRVHRGETGGESESGAALEHSQGIFDGAPTVVAVAAVGACGVVHVGRAEDNGRVGRRTFGTGGATCLDGDRLQAPLGHQRDHRRVHRGLSHRDS